MYGFVMLLFFYLFLFFFFSFNTFISSFPFSLKLLFRILSVKALTNRLLSRAVFKRLRVHWSWLQVLCCVQRGQSGLVSAARHSPIGLLCFPSSPSHALSLCFHALCNGWLKSGWDLAAFLFINDSWKRGQAATNMLCHSLWPLAKPHIRRNIVQHALVYKRCDSNAHVISISKSRHIHEKKNVSQTLQILDNFCHSGSKAAWVTNFRRHLHKRSPTPTKTNSVIRQSWSKVFQIFSRVKKCIYNFILYIKLRALFHISCLTCQGLSEDT